MFIAVLYVILLANIILHEIGHAVAMKNYGIEIKEISFGIGPTILSYKNIYFLKLLPLGGDVKLKESGYEKIEIIPAIQQQHILVAGIMINMMLSGLMLLSVFFLEGFNFVYSLPLLPLPVIFLPFGLIILGMFRRLMSKLTVVFGVLILAIMVYGLCIEQSSVHIIFTQVSSVFHSVSTISKILFLGSVISLTVGLFNCLPITGIDGGFILKSILTQKVFSNSDKTSWKVLASVSTLAYHIITLIIIIKVIM